MRNIPMVTDRELNSLWDPFRRCLRADKVASLMTRLGIAPANDRTSDAVQAVFQTIEVRRAA